MYLLVHSPLLPKQGHLKKSKVVVFGEKKCVKVGRFGIKLKKTDEFLEDFHAETMQNGVIVIHN